MGWFSKSSKDEQPAPASQPTVPAAPADRRHEPPAPAAAPQGSHAAGGQAGAAPTGDGARPAEAEVTRVSSLASVLTSALGTPRQAEQASQAPVAVRSSDRQSVFAESVDIEGSLEGEGDVLLRGRVHGSIIISGTLVIAETGRVQADVAAREVVNAGTVEGNIQAIERVRVQATGLVQGNIDSPSVVIDDGGGVEGYVQMGAEQPDEDETPPRGKQPGQPMPAASRAIPPPPAAREPAATVASNPGPGDGPPRGWDAQPPSAPSAAGSIAPPARSAAPTQPMGAGVAAQPDPQPASATLPPAATLPASTAGVALPPTGPRPPSAGLLFRPAAAPATAPAAAPSRAPIPAAGGPPASLASMAAAAAAGTATSTVTPPRPASDDPFADLESPTAPEPPGADDVPIL